MAKFYGKDTYLGLKEFKYFLWGLILILVPTAATLLLASFNSTKLTLTAVLITLLFVIVFLKPASNLLAKKGLQFYRGGAGEKAIRKILAELPDSFSVFEDVKTGEARGNIDFVVVSPTGMFLLEVKSHGGKVGFNGQALTLNGKPFRDKDFLRQVHGQVWALKQYLEKFGPAPYIHSAVVFSSAYASMGFGYHLVNNVYIIQKDFLPGLFRQFPTYQYPLPREKVESALLQTVNR